MHGSRVQWRLAKGIAAANVIAAAEALSAAEALALALAIGKWDRRTV